MANVSNVGRLTLADDDDVAAAFRNRSQPCPRKQGTRTEAAARAHVRSTRIASTASASAPDTHVTKVVMWSATSHGASHPTNGLLRVDKVVVADWGTAPVPLVAGPANAAA